MVIDERTTIEALLGQKDAEEDGRLKGYLDDSADFGSDLGDQKMEDNLVIDEVLPMSENMLEELLDTGPSSIERIGITHISQLKSPSDLMTIKLKAGPAYQDVRFALDLIDARLTEDPEYFTDNTEAQMRQVKGHFVLAELYTVLDTRNTLDLEDSALSEYSKVICNGEKLYGTLKTRMYSEKDASREEVVKALRSAYKVATSYLGLVDLAERNSVDELTVINGETRVLSVGQLKTAQKKGLVILNTFLI